MSDFAARQRRIYRAQSAAFLANPDLNCSAEALASISWSTLESVPHWCFLPNDEQRALRLLCGAVFLAPQMHRWIDGRRIQGVRELIGPDAYDLVLRSTDHLADRVPVDEVSGDLASALEEAGSAVLLGSVAHPVIQSLVAGSIGAETVFLANQIATPLYQKALEIFVQLRQRAQAADQIATAPEAQQPANGAGA